MQGGQDENMGMSTMMREVQELAEKFKVEEDEQYISPYAHLEKAAVLQEARYAIWLRKYLEVACAIAGLNVGIVQGGTCR